MKPSTLRALHRWIGLACAFTVLLATGSGILHLVMTWTQSPPPRPAPADSFTPPMAAFPISSLPADLLVHTIQVRLLEHEA